MYASKKSKGIFEKKKRRNWKDNMKFNMRSAFALHPSSSLYILQTKIIVQASVMHLFNNKVIWINSIGILLMLLYQQRNIVCIGWRYYHVVTLNFQITLAGIVLWNKQIGHLTTKHYKNKIKSYCVYTFTRRCKVNLEQFGPTNIK